GCLRLRCRVRHQPRPFAAVALIGAKTTMFHTVKQTSSRINAVVGTASWLAAVGLALGGCGVGAVETGSNAEAPTWQEFLDSTYKEPGPDGVWIVNGDEPITDEKKLREFYDSLYAGGSALIVHQAGNIDAKWNAQQRLDLTYCV